MNREIKFRGKRIDNGEWIFGNLHIPNKLFTGMFICPDTTYGDIAPGFENGDDFEKIKSYGAAIGHYHRVIPETVGQFTGLKDKNGKEIYEGDILCWPSLEGKKQQTRWSVSWNSKAARYYEWYSTNEEPEVIGNITDNPELLKQ